MDAASMSFHNKLGLGLRDQWTILDEWAALLRPALERAELASRSFFSGELAWRHDWRIRGQLIVVIDEAVYKYGDILRHYDYYSVNHRENYIGTYEVWNTIMVANRNLRIITRGKSPSIWHPCTSTTRRVYADILRFCGRFEMLLEYLN
jgi:hypothetical protein